jgi:adenosine kinase
LDLIIKKTGLVKDDLMKLAGTIIVTLGEKGSRLWRNAGELIIPARQPRRALDPTGCGDSFRGGLLSGLARGLEIEHCAHLGSVCASFCVEVYGTQEYRFSPQEFNLRFNGAL